MQWISCYVTAMIFRPCFGVRNVFPYLFFTLKPNFNYLLIVQVNYNNQNYSEPKGLLLQQINFHPIIPHLVETLPCMKKSQTVRQTECLG